MPNLVALASAGLAVAAGAGMTFIISTETFAVATLGGDDSCELGTLGVFTSSYTPECDPSKPGDSFTGADTLTFWPLFATQNNFGGAFESLGISALEEGTIPEGFPDEFDCQTAVSDDIDTFSAATNGIWASVDAALPGAVAAVINAPDPLSPPNVTNQDLGFQLQGAVGSIATSVFKVVFQDPALLFATETFDTVVPVGFDTSASNAASALLCSGSSAQRYANAAACQYIDTFLVLSGPGLPCEATGSNPWAVCTFSIGAVNVPRNVLMSETGASGSFGGVLGASPNPEFFATGSHLARWNEYVLKVLDAGIAGSTDPAEILELTTQKLTLQLGVGILQGCQQFANNDIDGCIDASGVSPTSAKSLTVIPGDLRAPYFLGCLLTGSNASDPLMGKTIDPLSGDFVGAGCMGALDSATGNGYASAFEVFGRFDASEVLAIPGLDPSAAALLGSIDTFAALLGGCKDASDTFTALEAGWQLTLAGTGRTENDFATSFGAGNHSENAALSAFCGSLLGQHALADANGNAPADDSIWATFVTNGACGIDLSGGVNGLLSDGAAQKSRCQEGTASFGLPKQVFEGVYSLDPIKQLTLEYAGLPKATEVNKQFILDAVVPKCNDDTEDAQAIANAQSLTPIATGLVFTGAAVGLVVTLMPVPPMVMLLPGVLTIVGAVMFTLALLGVRNAPVYSLIGQPCPDGNTCYAAGTGNKMALPTIAVALLSGIGLCVSAFVGNGNSEDYSSFKETQVGSKA